MTILKFLAAVAVCLAGAQAVYAQTYPNKPVKIIVPYQPGQGTDVATRYLAEHLSKALGQTVFVENKAGAGGNIGSAEAARAAPDGYTLLMGTNATHVLNQYLYASMPYDAEKDFEPVTQISALSMAVLAPANSPYKDLSDLLADAKARPDAISVALPSTTARLVIELLKQQTATQILGVPYRGSATSMTDLIGGQIPVGIDTVSAARTHVTAGKLKALAVTSLAASPLLPDAKPVAAQGVAGYEVIAWNALYAPRGTPTVVVAKLASELTKILNQAEVRQRLLDMGHEPVGNTPAQLAAFARIERAKWGPLIQRVGLRAE